MSEQIMSASGVQYGLIINSDGSLNISGTVTSNIVGSIVIGSVSLNVDTTYIQSGAALFGYNNNEIIRKASGSPAINYVFGAKAEAFMIDNLGSSPVYYALDATADPSSSGTGYLSEYSFRSFDAQVGSVSIQGSGTTTPSFQVVRIN